jgi:iron complex transport system permease protein
MKLLVDVEKLEADGTVTPEQAAAIRRRAAAETTSLAINLLSALGVIAVVTGIVALQPGTLVAAAVGAVLAAGGLLLRGLRPEGFGLLGTALVLSGALLHAGAALIEFKGGLPAFLYVFALFAALALWLKHGVFAALAVFALAGLLGSSTGYWHASYGLWVREPAFTILVFSLLAAAALWLARRAGPDYRRLANIFALLAIVWVNFGFWVGSLWGDHPGSSWAVAELLYSEAYNADRYQQLRDWYAQAFRIPAGAFAIAWAAGLLALGVWAASGNRRAVVNAAATFGAIHFYTQWFERLRASPEMVIAAGALAVAIAFALWRYNQRAQVAGSGTA